MSENPDQPSGRLDVKSIHQLVRLMKRYDMTDILLSEGTTRIRLRRRGPESVVVATSPVIAAAASAQAPMAAAAPLAMGSAPAAAANADLVIESPMVGTFYASPAPDAAPFVAIGGVVRSDTTVCVIEAMKVFTDIPAGVSGTITEMLVKNGQSVEFGQPLFRVRPT